MKIKDILEYLKTDYLLVADEANEYSVKYLHKNELTEDILNSNLFKIEPVMAIKKSIFESEADDSDFVSALKIVTSDNLQEEFVQDVYEESYQESPKIDQSYQRSESEHKEDHPNFNNPFGSGQFNPFSGLNSDFLSSLITPEMLESFTKSDLFKEMMSPENIKKTLESDDFKKFTQSMNLNDILGSMNNMYSNNPYNSSDTTNPEYEEYEEFDDIEEPDDDDDEYEEI